MESARAGEKVAIIERSKIGGTCINVACIPTKSIARRKRVVNLGTEPLLPSIEGLAESKVQTSDTFLNLTSLPNSIIILGGGYVGCEFADFLNTIGVQVTIVQGGNQ